jgi:hypothetical protein
VDSPAGEFRVDSVSACEKIHGEQAPSGDRRRKGRRPPSEIVEDEVALDEVVASGAAIEDDVAVEDYYAPSEAAEEPAP